VAPGRSKEEDVQQTVTAGWFGKIPALGDFASRRLSPAFIHAWDDWLQRGFAASRAQLGADWLANYLNSPIWRFALMPGVCGPEAWAGLVMPSVDKVGRHFPLTLAQPLPDTPDLVLRVFRSDRWYANLERTALAALDTAHSAEDLEQGLNALSFPNGLLPDDDDARAASALAEWLQSPLVPYHASALPGPGALPELIESAEHALFAARGYGKSLWWTTPQPAAPNRHAELRCFTGLPPATHFAALLQGSSAAAAS
jgi:type VI secretion system protein ImpM